MLNAKQIGARMRRARRLKDLTQHQLGLMTGVNSKTISRIERGKFEDLSLANVYEIAKALDISLDELIDHFPPVLAAPVAS